jgi:hypothetical protein
MARHDVALEDLNRRDGRSRSGGVCELRHESSHRTRSKRLQERNERLFVFR